MAEAQIKTVSSLNNFYTAVAGITVLLFLTLPFDNAFFHFATFLLFFLAGLALSQTGFHPLLQVLRDTKHIQIAFLLIILLMGISNLINEQNGEAWRALLVFIFRYWLLLVVLLFLHRCQLLPIRVLVFAIFLSLSVQFFPFMPEIYDRSIFSQRFQGFSSNANIIGLYAAIGVLLGSFCLGYSGNHVLGVMCLGFALAGLSAIILISSGSRASWVALVAALLVFTAFEVRQRPVFTSAFLASIAFFCLTVFGNFELPMERLNLLIEGYSARRDEVWRNALTLFWEKPFFGQGLDTRSLLSANHDIYSEHNIVLSVLTAMGSLGFVAYVYLMSSVCFRALINRNGVGLSLMTFLMCVGMFGFDFYRDQHFMICFIITIFFIIRSPDDFTQPSHN